MRVSFWGDELERITEVDPLTGEVLADRTAVDIYPARYFVTSRQKLEEALHDIADEMEEQVKLFEEQDKLLEAQRLRQRTQYDMEMLRADRLLLGRRELLAATCRAREAGSTPWTLLDYFPDDFVCFVDESHMTIPAGARHVQRRPRAQGSAGRLRVPPAVGAGQSAAHVPRVRAAAGPDGLCLGHARAVRV